MRFGGGGKVESGLVGGNLGQSEQAADWIGGEGLGRAWGRSFGIQRIAGFDEAADVELGQRGVVEKRKSGGGTAADVELAVGPEGEEIGRGGLVEARHQQILGRCRIENLAEGGEVTREDGA